MIFNLLNTGLIDVVAQIRDSKLNQVYLSCFADSSCKSFAVRTRKIHQFSKASLDLRFSEQRLWNNCPLQCDAVSFSVCVRARVCVCGLLQPRSVYKQHTHTRTRQHSFTSQMVAGLNTLIYSQSLSSSCLFRRCCAIYEFNNINKNSNNNSNV
jgi:hypothetical protein